MILPIVQPLYFNITNFNDTESASLIGYAGIAKTENGTLVLNPLINNGVGPSHLWQTSAPQKLF